MIVLRMVLIGLLVLSLISCGEKADDKAEATAKAAAEEAEAPIMKRSYEGELSQIQAGVHLQLKYDPETDAFVGVVRNATMLEIKGIQVTVELTDGTRLDPTEPIDLKPARPYTIDIPGGGHDFTTWAAHVTVAKPVDADKPATE